MLTFGTACQHVTTGRSVSVLTCLVCRHNVLGDGDSVLWAASPVHHSPPAFHREVDISMSCHWSLVNAQNWTQKGDHSKLSLNSFYTLWIFSLSNMCRWSSASLLGTKRSFWHSVTQRWLMFENCCHEIPVPLSLRRETGITATSTCMRNEWMNSIHRWHACLLKCYSFMEEFVWQLK